VATGKFSKVISLLNPLHKTTTELTFEKFYQRGIGRRGCERGGIEGGGEGREGGGGGGDGWVRVWRVGVRV